MHFFSHSVTLRETLKETLMLQVKQMCQHGSLRWPPFFGVVQQARGYFFVSKNVIKLMRTPTSGLHKLNLATHNASPLK